jgi:hypothetical protein
MKTKKQKKTMKQRKTRKQRKTKKQRKIRGGDLDANIKKTLGPLIENRKNNQGQMLNIACKNPDNCLALGAYGPIIKQYFDNFRNLSLVNNKNIKRIGKPSVNGFILEVPFTKNSSGQLSQTSPQLSRKNNFTAYTALKCAVLEDSDNLFYEYYVGKFFINSYLNIFPCFVETYDCYRFINENSWSKLKDLTNTNNINLADMIDRKNVSEEPRNDPYDNEDSAWFKMSCVENKNICTLIQHFDNFRSVSDEYRQNYKNIQYEIFNILYQVYFPLTILKDKYTHYDLHANNVFLYKPYEGKKYIQMRYHLLSGRIIEFPSEYIVKIIDYGRNYFDNGMTNTKKIIKDYICGNDLCDPECGAKVGYNVIQGNEYNPNTVYHWIFPNNKNISHDLIFAVNFYEYLIQYNIFDAFVYGNTEISNNSPSSSYSQFFQSGTPEKLGGDSRNIYNIVNLRDSLEAFMDGWNGQIMNQKYNIIWKKKAIMDIYEDQRPYTFEVLPDTA